MIAIHSTALGPVARRRAVLALRAASTTRSLDALRLSEAMTLKAAVAGLHQGGGKAVVQWDDPDRPRPAALLHALGRADRRPRRSLPRGRGRRRDHRRHERARARSRHGSPGSTSRSAARATRRRSPRSASCTRCARCCAELDGDRRSRSSVSCVQGAGHVGAHARRACSSPTGADVVGVGRLRRSRADGARRVSRRRACIAADAALRRRSATCSRRARSAACSTTVTIPRLQCRAIVGAANNQLGATVRTAMLAARGILYVARLRRERGRHHQHRRGVRRATTATRALEHTAAHRRDHDRACLAVGTRARASPRCAPPSSSPAAAIAEEGARPPLGTRRSRRLDERRPPHPAAPVTADPRRVCAGCTTPSACCRCGRASSGRAGATP